MIQGNISHGVTGPRCIQSAASKLHVCTTNVKFFFFFPHLALSLYSSLISLLLWLFSYLHKNPEINYICLTFHAACCHFAICRPACPVQCGAFKEPLWLSEKRESPFLLLLAPIQAFLLPFKWAVDEVSLIRLSQLTLVCAVCFPPKGVLTSPMLFSFILLFALFNQASTQGKKKPFQLWSQWTPLYTTVPPMI